MSASEAAAVARAIRNAVAERANDARAWWGVIANWSRAVLPISVALAVATLFVVVRTPTQLMTRIAASHPDARSARGVAIIDILATRTTSEDVVAALMPPTEDEMLEAAVRR